MEKPAVLQLSEDQLIAYNKCDIDAFCLCYHDDVCVMDESGTQTMVGMEEFRARYKSLFETYATDAWTTERLLLPPHIVEKERYVRRHRESGEETSGDIIVRYTEKDGKIAWVEFLR